MIGIAICIVAIAANTFCLGLGVAEGAFYYWNLISAVVCVACAWVCWEVSP